MTEISRRWLFRLGVAAVGMAAPALMLSQASAESDLERGIDALTGRDRRRERERRHHYPDGHRDRPRDDRQYWEERRRRYEHDDD